MKNTFLFILLASLFPLFNYGQTVNPDSRIIVIGEAEIEIPADRALFTIQITYSDKDNPNKALSEHKLAEAKLVDLFKELNIPAKNINYTPVSINKRFQYGANNVAETTYKTNQEVVILLDDYRLCSDFMIRVVNAGFSDIETEFSSSKEEESNNLLIEKALEAATQKANIMAKFANREVNRVEKIYDTEENDPSIHQIARKGWKSSSSHKFDLTSIPQTILRHYAVKVVFSLK